MGNANGEQLPSLAATGPLSMLVGGDPIGAAVTNLRTSASDSPTATNWTLDIRPLTSPAAPNSAQPQLAALGDRVVLS